MKKMILPLIAFACCCGCSSNVQEESSSPKEDMSKDCGQPKCGCRQGCGCSSKCACKG